MSQQRCDRQDLRAGTSDMERMLRNVEEGVNELLRENRRRKGKDIRLGELTRLHLEWVEVHRSDGTARLRRYYAPKLLARVGDMPVSELTYAQLEEFHTAERRKGDTENAGNEALRHVKTLLLWGQKTGRCELSFQRFPRMEHALPRTPLPDEAHLCRFLENADAVLRDFAVFALLTGLRPKEQRELSHEHVRYTGDGQAYLQIERHKTSRSARMPRPRTVPLSPLAEDILNRQFKSHPGGEHVFLNCDGGMFTRTVLRNRFVRLCAVLGIPNITPYSLRHLFATWQAEAGCETTSLGQLMGHSQVSTLQRYIKATHTHHRNAVRAVENRLRSMIATAAGEGE